MPATTKLKKQLAPGDNALAQDTSTPQNVGGRHDSGHWLRRPSTVARPEYVPFAKALANAMRSNKLSASEVARRIWGTHTDSRGYEVATNRDRIGHYLSGTSYPEPKNLTELAKAVGVSVDDLTIERRPPPLARAPRGVIEPADEDGVKLHFVDLETAYLSFRKTVDFATAMKIVELLRDSLRAGEITAHKVSFTMMDDLPETVDAA